MNFTLADVARFAGLALACIWREYPYHPMHVIVGPDDLRPPPTLHPAFRGCFDWHSAVHGHWLLVRVLRRFSELEEATSIRAALGENLTRPNLSAEVAYFEEPGRQSFERTYGWAWLLKLQEELTGWQDEDGRTWAGAIQPLADLLVQSYLEFLPRQVYPIRTGVHPNTAFGLAFALDYAEAAGREDLRTVVRRRSPDYYGGDISAPARWEPGGNDFFSPSLMEADLMRRVLPSREFAAWLDRFLPNLRAAKPESLLRPAVVTDRSDGQLVHLDGLNMSRAWCMWSIAAALPPRDTRRAVLATSAEQHARVGLQGIASDPGDGVATYMGDHWLGSFALYMLGEAEKYERSIA